MTKLEMALVSKIVELLYEPEVHEGSEKWGDYGGFDVEHRFVLQRCENDDPMRCGFGLELFVTKLQDEYYLGLYRTWEGEYGEHEGAVEALIRFDMDPKYSSWRVTEMQRLIRKVNGLIENSDFY